HAHVGEHHIHGGFLEDAQGVGALGGGEYAIALAGEHVFEVFQRDRLVFHDQHGCGVAVSVHATSVAAGGFRGRWMWKRMPVPGVLVTPMLPPCSVMISCTMARPRPQP